MVCKLVVNINPRVDQTGIEVIQVHYQLVRDVDDVHAHLVLVAFHQSRVIRLLSVLIRHVHRVLVVLGLLRRMALVFGDLVMSFAH